MSSLHLRALEPEDIESIYEWENDQTLWTSSNAHVPFSKHVLTQYIIESQRQDIHVAKQLRLVIEVNAQTIGCIDLCNLDFFNHRGEVSILINKDFRNRKYATSAITALCTYAKDDLQMHQLFAEILTENTASQRVFEKCGFQRTGVKKDWIMQNGEYKDVALYQKTL